MEFTYVYLDYLAPVIIKLNILNILLRSEVVFLRIGDRSFRTTAAFSDDFKFVICPAFAESISEGDLRWDKKVGDSVAEDEVKKYLFPNF